MIVTRKKAAITQKFKALGDRKAVAVIEYVGPEQTADMDGRVAFYLPKAK
jgi:hypothetical protein